MTKPFDGDAVLARNPQIQQDRVKEYLAYEKLLRDQGMLDARHYAVAPPLGRPMRQFDRQTTSSALRLQQQR